MRLIHRWWQARPRLLNNPIIRRELVARLRRGGSFFQLGLFLLAAALVILISWDSYLRQYAVNAPGLSGREYFLLLNLWQGIVALFVVPSLGAAAINIEYERKTWDLITTTPLILSSIFLGKFLSSILFVCFLLLSLIPVYGICFTMGGVAPQEILFVFLMIFEAVVVTALFGLLASINYPRTIRSVSIAYLLTFVYFVILPVSGAIGVNTDQYLIIKCFYYGLIVLSPIALSFHYFSNSIPIFSTIGASFNPFWLHGIEMTCFIAFLITVSLRKLSKNQHRPERKISIAIRNQVARIKESKSNQDNPIPDDRLIPDRSNPIHWKEMREFYGYSSFRFTLSILSLFLFGLILLTLHLDTRIHFSLRWRPVLPFIAILLTPCFVLSYGANTLRGERDRDTWDLLRTTTLKPWQIVWGKMKAGFHIFGWRFFAFYGLSLLVGIFTTLNGISYQNIGRGGDSSLFHFEFVLGSFLICLVSCCFYLSLSLWFSSWLRQTTRVYIFSFATVFFILFGFVLLFRFTNSAIAVKYFPSLFSPLFLCLNYGEGYRLLTGSSWWFALSVQAGWMLFLSLLLCWIASACIRERP